MTALFSWVNHADASDAVLTASHQSGDMTPNNLSDSIIGKRWRTGTLTGWAQVDFGADKSVGVLGLRFPRDTTFPTAGSIRWQCDADGGTPGSGVAYDSTTISIGATDGYGYHLEVPPAAISCRYVRFTFSSVTGVTFIDVGRLWAGESFVPTDDIVGGFDEQWRDLSITHVAERSGAEYVDTRPRQRAYAVGLEALSASERNSIREMQRIAGISKQILFSVDPTNFAEQTIIGRLTNTTGIKHRALSQQLYMKAFAIRESL